MASHLTKKETEKMSGANTIFLILSCLLLLLLPSDSHPLCTDSKAPFTPKTPLVFCPYNGSVCCDSNQDLGLQKLFQTMKIPDPACASLMKSILCAKCNQFSAELFKIETDARTVPVLCTASSNSTLSKGAANDFCAKVWDTCQDVSMLNSPFSPSLRAKVPASATTSLKLTAVWQSKSGFCEAFGGSSDDAVCFDGKSASLHKTETPQPPSGVCLEQISNGSYLDMAAHPDGSNRVFLASQLGKIWLATVPEEGSGEMVIDESNPFVDLTDMVHYDTELGLMSIAFHPNFAHNGRFFAAYNCDKVKWSGCSGRCSCNTDVNCDPSKLHGHNGAAPCQYHSVISEFTANGTASEPSLATRGNPSEVRRIFTMGLAYTNANGGQILFGPDGYLYFMTGDGENENDNYNLAQNKKSMLGKVLRFDIDNLPSAAEMTKRDPWGNYSIPRDNPHLNDKDSLPEIWALGFRNPWRCSFDSERPSYFLCADSGKDQFEEVDIVTKGGNYGWPFYEGTFPFHAHPSSGGNQSMDVMNLIYPVMGYDHSLVNTNEGSSSIAGGYVYRSKTDPCLYGKYLFSDLYGFAIWAGTENPENSGKFTTAKLSFSCAHNSPMLCSSKGSAHMNLNYVFAMGTDNKKDVFLLTSKGVLRVVRPSRCNYTCSKEDLTAYQNPQHGPSSSTGSSFMYQQNEPLLLFSFFLLLLLDLTL